MSHSEDGRRNANNSVSASNGSPREHLPPPPSHPRQRHERRFSWGKRSRKSKPKEVAFADDALSSPQEELTFYREGTPPPEDGLEGPPITIKEATDTGGYSYDYRYDHVAPPAPIPVATVCGIRKRLFWSGIAGIFLLIAIGVGVGVGVGIGAKHKSSSTSSSTPDAETHPLSASSGSQIPTISPTATPSATATALDSCPAANGTKYTVPKSDKTFLRVCGVDYGKGGATDLGVIWTASMQDCMNNCAGYPNCTGCGWGVIEDDPGSDHRCWLKSDLEKSHDVRSGWDFAILE